MTWRAAVYTRISRDEDSTGAGVARQEEDCRALCARRGWKVAEVLCDNDVSAYSGRHRPAYGRLLQRVRAESVDVVVAYSPERLHRSPRELEDFIDLIERRGVRVETVRAGSWDLQSSHGRMVARMLGVVSRAESERLGERVSRAHQQAKAEGRWRGPIPFGMRASTHPGMPEPDPAQVRVVREVADLVIRGDALTRIAADLNARGVRPRRGAAWTHTGVLRLMQTPALGGLVLADHELRRGAFEGPLDEATWRSVQAALARRSRGEARRPRESLTLLGGVLVCAVHNSVLYGASGRDGRYYRAKTPGVCSTRISRDDVDELVRAAVVGRLGRKDAREVLLRPPSAGVEDEMAVLRARRREIASLVSEGLLPLSEARPSLERINARLAELDQSRTPGLLEDRDLVDPAEAWERWSMVQRREVVRVLFSMIGVAHGSSRNGPRADLSRVLLRWRQDAFVG